MIETKFILTYCLILVEYFISIDPIQQGLKRKKRA